MRCLWILYLFVSSFCFAQNSMVLDGPFIHEKELIFESMPELVNIHLNEVFHDTFDNWNTEANYIQRSFLYSEHEYNRVRVYQEIDLDQKDQLKRREIEDWAKNGDYYISPTGSKVPIDDVKYFPDSFSREYSRIMEDTTFKSWDDPTMTLKDLHRNNFRTFSEGTQIGNLHYPKTSSDKFKSSTIIISDFNTIVSDGLDLGAFSLYAGEDFRIPYTYSEIEKDALITSVRLKTDYFINLISGNIESKIIGLGLYSNDKVIGWMYYPEFRWLAKNYYNYFETDLLAFDHVLESNFLESKAIGIYGDENPKSYFRHYFDSEWCVWLDPYVFKQLNEAQTVKEIPIIDEWSFGSDTMEYGYAQCFYEDSVKRYSGNSLVHENMNGIFEFYHRNGSIKAIHNYENGDLHGEQQLFYKNGQEYARYRMDGGEILDLVRYFENGVMMEKGEFNLGIPAGRWSHTVKCNDEEFAEVKNYLESWDNIGVPKIYIQQEGYYTYFIEYEFERCDNCPPLFHKNGKVQGVLRKKVVLE